MTSARDKIRSYLEENVGKVVTTSMIREVAGISEYARRIRELRDEEGMRIRTHIDRHDLKLGEYVLEDLKREPKINPAAPAGDPREERVYLPALRCGTARSGSLYPRQEGKTPN